MNNNTPCPFSGQMKYVDKGWGFEIWIDNNEEYCGKLLFMYAGKKLSWHYHKLKRETFYVASGKVKVIYGETDDMETAKEIILEKGMNFQVHRGLRHRLYAFEDSEIYEFSTQHFDEDSIRIEKGD